MKTYEVVLTKSYIVKIKAENRIKAKEYSEYFTNDIQNISTIKDEKQYKFKIENIDCKVNGALDVKEINENN
ncbi:MAG TPA: hypothetical protein PK762_10950 [Candidatus Kapabacteria bacterium]|nr:hypothetical protein [Candidatus Kapabacteria bacterium]